MMSSVEVAIYRNSISLVRLSNKGCESTCFDPIFLRGTQRIVSVNYLFGGPLIPYNFLNIIFASSFRDMGNLRPGVFGLIKMSFRVPKKGQLRISERK